MSKSKRKTSKGFARSRHRDIDVIEKLRRIKGVREQKIDLAEVVSFVRGLNPDTVVYVGGDSQGYKHNGENWTLFIVVIGVHIDGCKGVKVFKQAEWLRDYSGSMRQRLIAEVSMIVSIAGSIMDELGEKRIKYMIEHDLFDVHLDINSNEKHASNVVMKEAMGYVKGVLGITPKVKPDSFMASIGADRWTKC